MSGSLHFLYSKGRIPQVGRQVPQRLPSQFLLFLGQLLPGSLESGCPADFHYCPCLAQLLNVFRPNCFSSSVNSCWAFLNLAVRVIFITALVLHVPQRLAPQLLLFLSQLLPGSLESGCPADLHYCPGHAVTRLVYYYSPPLSCTFLNACRPNSLSSSVSSSQALLNLAVRVIFITAVVSRSYSTPPVPTPSLPQSTPARY